MRRLIVLGVLALVGVGAWQIGNRLSTDAVGMGIGLVFGVLAGVPAALLVLATGRRTRRDDVDDDAWDAGYRTGMRETTALALGTRPQLEQHDGRTIDGSLAAPYTHARPFGLLPVAPALPYRCPVCLTLFGGPCCPECGDTRQWRHDDPDIWAHDGTPRRDGWAVTQ